MFDQGKTLISNWKKNRVELSNLFHNKQYELAVGPMKTCLDDFTKSLYIVNNEQWNEHKSIEFDIHNFRYKPFNVIERVRFIKDHPKQYHCYIQLNELFKEIEKIYAKAEIMEKNKKTT